MALLGIKKEGKKMATPNLSSIVKNGAMDMMKAGSDGLEEDWSASPDIMKCGACKGTGFDFEDGVPCIGCDGSGKDYEIHYGVKDGAAYAYVVQYGHDAIIEYCKACREAEVDNLRVNAAMLRAFVLPQAIRMDLIAAGWPVDEMVNSGNNRELANHIAKSYPEYLTTNLTSF